MHHGLAIVEAWVDEITDPHKGIESAVMISSQFAETDVSRGFINGFTMHMVRMNGAGFQALGSHSRHTIPWGTGHHAEFRRRFGHGISIVCMGDDLPLPENRVTLSETVVDSSGLPAPKIVYNLHPNDRRMMDFAIDRAVDVAERMRRLGYRHQSLGPFRQGLRPQRLPSLWHLPHGNRPVETR